MNNILAIFQLVPALIAAIKAIEEAIPGQGQSEAKLAAVRAMLEAVDGTFKSLWPQVASVIAVLVPIVTRKAA